MKNTTTNTLYKLNFNGLMPTKIHVLKNDSIIERDFDVMDWISISIKKVFHKEVILKAISNLNIHFMDLYNLKEYVNNIPIDVYSIHNFKVVETHKNKFHDVKIDKYYKVYVPSELSQGKLFIECLLITYPKLKELYRVSIDESNDINDIRSSSVWLANLPESLKDMTINEILALPNDYKIETKVFPLDIYLNTTSDVKFYFKTRNGNSNGIFLDDLISKNFEKSEEHSLATKTRYEVDIVKNTKQEEIDKIKDDFQDKDYIRFKKIIQEE